MKKIISIVLVSILLATFISSSAQDFAESQTINDEWTGEIRIEGKNDTIWKGNVTVGQVFFNATNVDTATIEEYNISYPSALGALIEASILGDFSYSIDYYPSWNAFIITSVEDDSDWWHYWVDYEMPMVGAGDYQLKNDSKKVLFGYLESWDSHPLKIDLSESEVKINEEFTVTVLNETDSGVQGATVHVGSSTYTTDINGSVVINMSLRGNYNVYAEKEGFVRSDKKIIQVKTIFEIILEKLIILFEWILEILNK